MNGWCWWYVDEEGKEGLRVWDFAICDLRFVRAVCGILMRHASSSSFPNLEPLLGCAWKGFVECVLYVIFIVWTFLNLL